jgi:hypothetical protein
MSWLSARTYSRVAWMVLLIASACSEGDAQEGVANSRSPGQALTFTDLEGAKIHAKLVTEMLVQREGGPKFTLTNEGEWNITVEPGATISWSFRQTARGPRGTRSGPKLTNTAVLDQAFNTRDGEASWQFNGGKLMFVRSSITGATRTTFDFNQDGINLMCTASIFYARERGKNSLVITNNIDGAQVTIISWKPVSSPCSVMR